MDVSQGSTDPWSHGAMGAGIGPENRARITRYQGECASGCAGIFQVVCRQFGNINLPRERKMGGRMYISLCLLLLLGG